ncbi:hypothetical protein SEVIR_2G034432v4 [Setaria viridis]|uniref:F-box domain-containing protein n=1 Tax=Setaria viridis TaxID=4556 RepID=A0A4U6VNW6_SETVI|nr:hypothetical protein SEVIR_2G034432v2 [Setaria viridis]
MTIEPPADEQRQRPLRLSSLLLASCPARSVSSLPRGRTRPATVMATAPPGDPPPPDSADDCIPLKKRTLCGIQQHVQTPDRISSLPDDILVSILSLMTVREAAMTDCLSTRWRHLWAIC